MGLSESGADASGSREAVLSPFLDAISAFRNEVRKIARGAGEKERQALMELCDKIRDDVFLFVLFCFVLKFYFSQLLFQDMPKLGVRLEDDGKFPWKLGTPEEVIKQIKEKKIADLKAAITKKKSKFVIFPFFFFLF